MKELIMKCLAIKINIITCVYGPKTGKQERKIKVLLKNGKSRKERDAAYLDCLSCHLYRNEIFTFCCISHRNQSSDFHCKYMQQTAACTLGINW